MTDQPSEAALRKACEVLGLSISIYESDTYNASIALCIVALARHFDAEDKAAREAVNFYELHLNINYISTFARRHILPDPKSTVQDIMRKHIGGGSDYDALAQALRDAGLLREGA